MAIYIGLEKLDENDGVRRYRFFKSNDETYGILAVNLATFEFTLLESVNERAEEFAYPRACRAIVKAAERGDIPDKLCWAA